MFPQRFSCQTGDCQTMASIRANYLVVRPPSHMRPPRSPWPTNSTCQEQYSEPNNTFRASSAVPLCPPTTISHCAPSCQSAALLEIHSKIEYPNVHRQGIPRTWLWVQLSVLRYYQTGVEDEYKQSSHKRHLVTTSHKTSHRQDLSLHGVNNDSH